MNQTSWFKIRDDSSQSNYSHSMPTHIREPANVPSTKINCVNISMLNYQNLVWTFKIRAITGISTFELINNPRFMPQNWSFKQIFTWKNYSFLSKIRTVSKIQIESFRFLYSPEDSSMLQKRWSVLEKLIIVQTKNWLVSVFLYQKFCFGFQPFLIIFKWIDIPTTKN